MADEHSEYEDRNHLLCSVPTGYSPPLFSSKGFRGATWAHRATTRGNRKGREFCNQFNEGLLLLVQVLRRSIRRPLETVKNWRFSNLNCPAAQASNLEAPPCTSLWCWAIETSLVCWRRRTLVCENDWSKEFCTAHTNEAVPLLELHFGSFCLHEWHATVQSKSWLK